MDDLRLPAPDDTPFPPRLDCDSTGEAIVFSWPSRVAGPAIYRFAGGEVGWQQLAPITAPFPGAGFLHSGRSFVLWPDAQADSYHVLTAGAAEWRRVAKPAAKGHRKVTAAGRVLLSDTDGVKRQVFVIDPFAHARRGAQR
jgi:hypothetical protein